MAKISAAKNKKVAVPKSKKVVQKPVKKVMKKVAAKPKQKKVSAIPKGYHSITPYLIISNNAAGAINFYKKVFDAKETMRMEGPGKKVMHAELKMGDAQIMLADECPGMHFRGPQAYGGSPVGINLYIKNVDDVVKKAVKNGAKVVRPAEDMFYGDRSANIEDPYGHLWTVATHIEDVTPAKMKKRMAALFNKKA